jgi:hypothetical protein
LQVNLGWRREERHVYLWELASPRACWWFTVGETRRSQKMLRECAAVAPITPTYAVHRNHMDV